MPFSIQPKTYIICGILAGAVTAAAQAAVSAFEFRNRSGGGSASSAPAGGSTGSGSLARNGAQNSASVQQYFFSGRAGNPSAFAHDWDQNRSYSGNSVRTDQSAGRVYNSDFSFNDLRDPLAGFGYPVVFNSVGDSAGSGTYSSPNGFASAAALPSTSFTPVLADAQSRQLTPSASQASLVPVPTAPVPAPATWMTMVAGLGLMSILYRRRAGAGVDVWNTGNGK